MIYLFSTFTYATFPYPNLHDRTHFYKQGKQKQQKRTNTFFEFCNATQGTLLCTDVAARGLDIPQVDWIVQFDPPDDPRDYIHRVGRTARAGKSGKSLLFLLESELGFLRYLKEARVPLNEFGFPTERIANVQTQVRVQCQYIRVELANIFAKQLEKLLKKNYYLHQSARDGYRSYLQAYASYSLKKIFDVNKLDLAKVGKAFGFDVPPRVNISFSSNGDMAMSAGSKRPRAQEGEDEWTDEEDESRATKAPKSRKKQNKNRNDTVGSKQLDKDVYRKEKIGGKKGTQWSR